MKVEKIGLTTMNWILSILGILVLSCFIILPPVFRVVFKEEVKEEIPEEIIIKTLICEKNNIITDQYIENSIFTFHYFNDRIRIYSKESNRTYNDSVIYANDKQQFGRYVAAFSILSGYGYSIDPDDDHYIIKINEKYDLGLFQPTVITVPGDTLATSIDSTYTLNDSVSNIQHQLVNDGYICR